MFILFAIFLTAQGGISVSQAEFTSYDKCTEASAALQQTPTPNKFFVCTAK